MLRFTWVLVAACCLICPTVRSSSAPIESSMTAESDGNTAAVRFMAVTKTMATTTTVLATQTVYVHPSCLYDAGTKPCALVPPTPPPTPAPTTTTTPTPTTTTSTSSTTTIAPTTPTTTAKPKPWIEIVPGSVRPFVSGMVTINKVDPPKVQIHLPQKSDGDAPAADLARKRKALFNMPLLEKKRSMAVSGGTARRGRTHSIEENIQPSAVRTMEVTASPELSMMREDMHQDVAVETSRSDDSTSFHEYELVGLTSEHLSNQRGLFGGRVTMVKLDKVTVTASVTVTATYPVVAPTDRVTIAYLGCVPTDAPVLPKC